MFEEKAGLVGAVTGLLGALSALGMLAWPPQVPEGVMSYPLTATGFLVVQVWFFVHHLGLVLLLVALARSGAAGGGRLARSGAWLAVAAMVGLSLAELFAMRYAEWNADEANEGPMGTAYGISVTLTGLGLLAAGAGVLRARRWTGWHRWTPLCVGAAVFLVVTPGMFGGYVLARLAIGAWMLLLGALGWALYAEASRRRDRGGLGQRASVSAA